MTDSLWNLPALAQGRGIAAGDWTAVEVMTSVLERVAERDPAINAICTLDAAALDNARAADAALRAGRHCGPLHGVPFTVKDLIPTAGVRTTLGSVAHRDWVPDSDELSVARLRAAGAILVGKTNTREFGYGIVTDNTLFGPTHNPWDERMTAAGSSGGAAAAVASGMGSIALGSDGGGSLRVPAAVCGILAVKPTFGVVALYPSCRAPLRTGLDSWETLECIGPLSRTASDAAAVLQAIAGFDSRDRHSAAPGSVRFGLPDSGRVRRLRVLYSADLGIAEVAPDVAAAAQARFDALAAAYDWEVVETVPALPSLVELRETFHATVAMDTDLVGLRKLAAHYPVSRDIAELVGRAWTTDDFDRARTMRRQVSGIMLDFSAAADLVLTPTTATTAFPIGLRFPPDREWGIDDGRQWSPFAFLANLTGQPAASIPAGLSGDGLPIGLQATTRRFGDMLLLDLAQAAEDVPTDVQARHTTPGRV